ncbi:MULTISPECIES: hypothetical protein [unclassified Streptomyces]
MTDHRRPQDGLEPDGRALAEFQGEPVASIAQLVGWSGRKEP